MPFTPFPQISVLQKLASERGRKVFLVGGFLRDFLLSRPNNDLDFTVDREALALARGFADAIGGAFVILDEERGCARVVFRQDGRDLTFDFADYRAPTLEEDILLRDFTINTLYADLLDIQEGRDFSRCTQNLRGGLEDLNAGIVRRVSDRSLVDDPLRLMRAFSLRAQLGFLIESETLQQISGLKSSLRSVSYERIRDELFKILESPRAGMVIREMDKIGFLETVIPQIRVMYGCLQGGYHHLDVWPHSLEALNQFEKIIRDFEADGDIRGYLAETVGSAHSRAALIKLGIILHDIGKPDTRREEGGGRISFHGHENVGKDITHHVAHLLKLSNEERHALEDMVQWHLRPGYLSNEEVPTERAIYRYFRDTGEEGAGILLLSLADQRATRGPLTSEQKQIHHENICLGLIRRFFDKRKEAPFVPLINGHDLIREFQLAPSPLIGEILKDVCERQALGEITRKEDAMSHVQKHFLENHDDATGSL